MPVYLYECKSCGKEYEDVNSVDNRNNSLCRCGGSGRILLSATAKPVVFVGYHSENLGAEVTGPKQRERLIKQKGLTAIG